MPAEPLSYCAEEVRRHDRDRFLTALFAPADRRDDLLTLYAFNLELAKIRETVREPMLGRIRLQWWRETLEGFATGAVRQHAVAAPLAAMLARRPVPPDLLARMIDGRELDLEPDPPVDLDALEAYADQTSGSLVIAALALLDGGEPGVAAARHVGIAHALAGLALAVPFRAAQGRVDLPQDLLAEVGLHPTSVKEARGDPRLAQIVRVVALRAAHHLAEARRRRRDVPRAAHAALLPAVLADRALRRLAAAGHDPFAVPPGRDALLPLRLAWAGARGRY